MRRRAEARQAVTAGLLALAVCGACAPRLTVADLPLSPLQLEALRDRVRPAAEGPADAGVGSRDLGWLELLYGGRPDLAAVHFDRALVRGHDPLALLGRALVREGAGDADAVAGAWVALATACHRSREPVCVAAAQLALSRLATSDAPVPALLRRRLEPLARSGPPAQRDLALRVLARLARRRGDPRELQQLWATRGCPRTWRVSGPWHRNAHVDLDRPVSHGSAGRLVSTPGCKLELRTHRRWGGVYWATTEVVLRRARRLALTVDTGHPWQLVLGGRPVWTHGTGQRRAPRVQVLGLRLPAGRHLVGLKVGTGSGYAALSLRLVPWQGREPAVRLSAPAAGAVSPDGTPVEVRVRSCVAPDPHLGPSWYAPLVRYLAAEGAVRCGDRDRAYRDLARARTWAPRFAAPRLLELRTVLDDPLRPRSVAEEQAVKVLGGLAPERADALQLLGDLVLRQGRTEEALRIFRAGARRWPRAASWQEGLHRVFRELSYPGEEEQALRRAVAIAPRRCDLLEQLAGVTRTRHDVDSRLRLIFTARRCDAGSALLARFLRDSGDLKRAAAEYQRVLGLRPQAAYLRRELVHVLHLLGRDDAARRQLHRILGHHPGSVEDEIELADLWAAGGQRGRAIDVLRWTQRHMPWASEARHALERLTGRSIMAAHRLDGRRAIREYLRSGQHAQGAPAVVVLDRMVTEFQRDGSSVSLTHNIVQVLTKRGIERWGEVEVPEGADLLTLRTVKPDGSTREPEELLGKKTVSMPALERGDFVEVEYLDASPPPAAFSSGAAGERFYFASFEFPLVRSEYLVLAPVDLPLAVDRRGWAPAPRRSVARGMVRLSWVVKDQQRVVPEPGAPPAEEYMPSVRLIGGASWPRLQDYYREQALVATRGCRISEQIARRVTARLKGSTARARALYRWVVREIEKEGPQLASAARTLAARRGSRPAALVALLRGANIPAELWLVRPLAAAGGRESRVPETEAFGALLVRCEPAGKPVFLQTDRRWLPFGYVTPGLRGAVALRLAPGEKPLARVPGAKPGADRRRIQLAVKLSADGSARFRVVERLHGIWAARWRSQLEQIDRNRLSDIFEQRYLGAAFPGASIDSVDLAGAATRGRPLELHYRFRMRNLCQPEHGTLRCSTSFFAPGLTRRYVRVPRRKSPLLVGLHPETEIRALVTPPTGWRAVSLPAGEELNSVNGRFRRSTGVADGGAVLQRTSLEIPRRRISPRRFPSFARFARRVDRAFDAPMTFAPKADVGL